ncbi:TetR/AcrR family transcriptional regulator [Photobacterium sanguinicancri]|uniref:TetR/AcrR family transcriptional regulator n=2 Tax=Photobacterium sanguinicancri TaxID=875932 RepID=A0AAW7Y9Y6_9GAMM|nr:TetR/AcrR family transcriptional regulator [Photobacterium sanguinicancri]MDO6544526.1 TetR/AcrR family transcriptional regulator [Photobacterium sanguinicancri]
MLSEAKTRKKILSNATDLFAHNPYGKVTIRKIAQSANVSPSLIIYYFISKENLYCQIFEEFFPELENMIKKLKKEPKLTLSLIVNSYIEVWRINSLIPIIIHRELLSLDNTEAKNRLANKLLIPHKKKLMSLLSSITECSPYNEGYYYMLVISLSTYPFISDHICNEQNTDMSFLQNVYESVLPQAVC